MQWSIYLDLGSDESLSILNDRRPSLASTVGDCASRLSATNNLRPSRLPLNTGFEMVDAVRGGGFTASTQHSSFDGK